MVMKTVTTQPINLETALKAIASDRRLQILEWLAEDSGGTYFEVQ